MLHKLFHFEEENKFLIQNSTLNGVSFWDTIRVQFYMNSLSVKMPKVSPAKFNKIKTLFLFLNSIPRLFFKYDYVFITSDSEKKTYNSLIYDKSISGICSSIKNCRTLVIDYSLDSDKSTDGYDNVVNGYLFNFLAKCLKPFLKTTFNKESEQLFKHLKVVDNFDYKNYLISINALNKIFFIFFKLWSPKKYFSSCYSYYSANFCANKLQIPSFEIQHGIITNGHPAYSSKVEFSTEYRCKKLLAFGDSIFSFLTTSNIFKHENIVVIGNAYIDLLKKNRKPLKYQTEFKTIIVPTDWSVEDDLIKFVISILDSSDSINFIITPRIDLKIDNYKKIKSYDTRISIHLNQFQSQIQNSDICLTIDSTCALEACAFGIPSILYDLDNRATNFYGHVFNDENAVSYVLSPYEALNVIENWPFSDKSYIESIGNTFYNENYFYNINRLLNG